MPVKTGKRRVVLDPFEHRLMIRGLHEFRSQLLRQSMPTEDVDGLLLKVIDAPTVRERRRRWYERT